MAKRILIADDLSFIRMLQKEVLSKGGFQIVGEAANGRAALAAIRRLEPDVVFLDIEMPGMTGLDVVGQLPKETTPLIVFVTAYDRYAVEAFEAHAVDYVLKPLDEERFADALENVRRQLDQRKAADQRDRLVQLMADLRGSTDWPDDLAALQPPDKAAAGSARALAVRQGREILRVPLADIDWIDAAGDYMCVHAAGETHILRGTMKSLEDVLDPAVFQRVHRSRSSTSGGSSACGRTSTGSSSSSFRAATRSSSRGRSATGSTTSSGRGGSTERRPSSGVRLA